MLTITQPDDIKLWRRTNTKRNAEEMLQYYGLPFVRRLLLTMDTVSGKCCILRPPPPSPSLVTCSGSGGRKYFPPYEGVEALV